MRNVAFAAAACALLAALPAAAQPAPCTPTETLKTCWDRVSGVAAFTPPAADSAASSTEAELQGKATGIALQQGSVQSALRSFLPQLAADLVSQGDAPDALAAEFNQALQDGVVLDLGASLKARVEAHQSQLYQPLVDSLLAGGRAASRDRLQTSLGDLGDVSLILSLNRESTRWGRGFRQHRGVVDSIFTALLPQPKPFPVSEFIGLIGRIRANLLPDRADAPECDPQKAHEVRFSCLQPAFAAELSERLVAAALSERERLNTFDATLEHYGFDFLAELINNQPQLQATGEYRAREQLVGPSEWTGSLRLEMGFANMNGLRRFCGVNGVDTTCLRRYTSRPEVRAALRRSDRAFLSADFSRRESYHLLLPDDTVAIDLDGEWQATGSAGYGRYLGVDADGDETGRIDARLDFAHYGGDPTRQDRFVASATYTHKVNDQASAVFGFTWASRPELIGDDVTKKVGAHLGLTYKLTKPQS